MKVQLRNAVSLAADGGDAVVTTNAETEKACEDFVFLHKPFVLSLIRETGLEPVRLSALEPKSNASASSATLAC